MLVVLPNRGTGTHIGHVQYQHPQMLHRAGRPARRRWSITIPARRGCVASRTYPAPENHEMAWVLSHFFAENRRFLGVFFRASEPLRQKVYVKLKSPINGANQRCTIVYISKN